MNSCGNTHFAQTEDIIRQPYGTENVSFVYSGDNPVGFYSKQNQIVCGSIGKSGEPEPIQVCGTINVYKKEPFDVCIQSMTVTNTDGCSLYPFNQIEITREEGVLPMPMLFNGNRAGIEERSISRVIAYVNDRCDKISYLKQNYGLSDNISIVYEADGKIYIRDGRNIIDVSKDSKVSEYLNVVLQVKFSNCSISVIGNSECGNYELSMQILSKAECNNGLDSLVVPTRSISFDFNGFTRP